MEMNYDITEIRNRIINWYNKNWEKELNKYPWRVGKKNSYQILITEILLQHTTAKAVVSNDSYHLFLNKFPSIKELKKAPLLDLEAIFKPLGLYNQKPQRILKLVDYLIKKYNGKIPNNKKELLDLPGVGEYIANAILTFSYGLNEVPLDNNLKRIGLNVWNLKKKLELVAFYKELAELNPKVIYWALFDIGRFHCRKPIPNCKGCPLNCYCLNRYSL